jgi:hypothetical protein
MSMSFIVSLSVMQLSPGVRQLRSCEEIMRNERRFIGSLALLLTVFVGQTVLAQNVQKRDLARYDDGGNFDFNWAAGPEAHERMRPKLRQFLWEHWSQKRLGHVVAAFYSIEGDPIRHTFYIEPDGNGRWHVVSEYERECCWSYALLKKKRKRKLEKGKWSFDTVERVEQTEKGKGAWKVIPEGENREPGTYWLRLRNGNDSADAALEL